MGEYFADIKRAEVAELQAQLNDPKVDRSPQAKLAAIKKVIGHMTAGIDMSGLFSEMIKATHTKELAQKKLVYLYLANYCEAKPELIILVVNTLQKDSTDRMQDPTVRGLALRTLTSLRVPNLVEYVIPVLKSALTDQSPYVRKTAAMGVAKMHALAPFAIKENGMVRSLYGLVKDRDPQVVVNAIAAIDEVEAGKGGITVNKALITYLLNRIREFNEWGQCLVLDKTAEYEPADDDERWDILNILDGRLSHINGAVVLAAIKVFIRMTQHLPDVAEDVFQRVKAPLLTQLSGSGPERMHVAMGHLRVLLHRSPRLLDDDYKHFFIRYSDSSSIKALKLQLLEVIGGPTNGEAIISELSEYVTDVDRTAVRAAIQAVGRIAVNHTACARVAVETLLGFVALDIDHVTSVTIVVLQDLLRKYPDIAPLVMPSMRKFLDEVDEEEAKASLVWMLGEHADKLPEAPYLLEELVDGFEDEPSSSVRLQILTAAMKMFFKRPPECQATLGSLLEQACNDSTDVDVHDRALLYYRLLKTDVHQAADVVGKEPMVVQSFAESARQEVKDRVFDEFNTLAVMYGVPSDQFIVRRAPYTKGLRKGLDTTSSDDDSHGSGGENAVYASGDAGTGSSPTPASNPAAPAQTGSSPTPAQTARRNLLDDDLSFSLEPRAAIVLRPYAAIAMSPNTFQAEWGRLPVSATVETALPYTPTAESIERKMTAANVKAIASGVINGLAKFYFFAIEDRSDVSHLIELKVSLADGTASATFKSPASADVFVSHFKSILLAPE